MLKILQADRDTYLTNKVVDGDRQLRANVGAAGSLDLYKLYDVTRSGSVPNTELTRLLIHFDLTRIKELYAANKIDVTSPSFWCKIKLHDVYGGQTTPSNFTVVVNPLSASFEEGLGRDVATYGDYDASNFLSSSTNTLWHVSGCGLSGSSTTACDFIDTLNGSSLTSTQTFKSGFEDLYVDVTNIISATLTQQIPDEGFRIAFSEQIEQDNYTYFAKRFASRTAYNDAKHPKLYVGYDDSMVDSSQLGFKFDLQNTAFLYNIVDSSYQNIVSASQQVTGSNCVLYRLSTEVSGGRYELVFTGSQVSTAGTNVTGKYVVNFTPSSTDLTISSKLQESGSVKFDQIWSSLDQTVTYLSGEEITVEKHLPVTTLAQPKYVVTLTNVKKSYLPTEIVQIRTNIFDDSSPLIKLTRLPRELPSLALSDVYYSIRDAQTNDVIIEFDLDKRSTRLSADTEGMFFELDVSNLQNERLYVIDILIKTPTGNVIYKDASQPFKVTDTQ